MLSCPLPTDLKQWIIWLVCTYVWLLNDQQPSVRKGEGVKAPRVPTAGVIIWIGYISPICTWEKGSSKDEDEEEEERLEREIQVQF